VGVEVIVGVSVGREYGRQDVMVGGVSWWRLIFQGASAQGCHDNYDPDDYQQKRQSPRIKGMSRLRRLR